MQGRFGNDEFVQLDGATAIGYYSLLCMTVNAAEKSSRRGRMEMLKV